MKRLLTIFIIALVGTACEDELFQDIHPESDEAALAAMGEAFEMASAYQDSIVYYTDVIPDAVKVVLFDEQFHIYSMMYDTNHLIYSHMNASDDHHHTPNPPAHGHHNVQVEMPFGDHHDESGDEHEDEHGDGHEEEYHHTMENHLKMLSIQQNHLEYHPN